MGGQIEFGRIWGWSKKQQPNSFKLSGVFRQETRNLPILTPHEFTEFRIGLGGMGGQTHRIQNSETHIWGGIRSAANGSPLIEVDHTKKQNSVTLSDVFRQKGRNLPIFHEGPYGPLKHEAALPRRTADPQKPTAQVI